MCTLTIVDDDPIFHRIIHLLNLKLKLFKSIVHHQDARELLEYIAGHKNNSQKLPDALLVDVNMPRFNGWEFLDAMQHVYPSLSKPFAIYVVSTSIVPDDKARAEKFTCVKEFMIKPLTLEQLKAIYQTAEDNTALW